MYYSQTSEGEEQHMEGTVVAQRERAKLPWEEIGDFAGVFGKVFRR